jgi:hypothetical protein
MLLREFVDTTRGGMNALEKIIEGETALNRNHNLGVENELLCSNRPNRFDQFGKVARE